MKTIPAGLRFGPRTAIASLLVGGSALAGSIALQSPSKITTHPAWLEERPAPAAAPAAAPANESHAVASVQGGRMSPSHPGPTTTMSRRSAAQPRAALEHDQACTPMWAPLASGPVDRHVAPLCRDHSLLPLPSGTDVPRKEGMLKLPEPERMLTIGASASEELKPSLERTAQSRQSIARTLEQQARGRSNLQPATDPNVHEHEPMQNPLSWSPS